MRGRGRLSAEMLGGFTAVFRGNCLPWPRSPVTSLPGMRNLPRSSLPRSRWVPQTDVVRQGFRRILVFRHKNLEYLYPSQKFTRKLFLYFCCYVIQQHANFENVLYSAGDCLLLYSICFSYVKFEFKFCIKVQLNVIMHVFIEIFKSIHTILVVSFYHFVN